MIGILLVLGTAVVVLAVSVTPFLLPWHQRLRWLIAASTVPDPMVLGSIPWFGLEEITLTTVTSGRGGLIIDATSGPAGPARPLWLDCFTHEDRDHLECSAADGMPLLLVNDASGAIALHGPTWSVSGLTAAPRRQLSGRIAEVDAALLLGDPT